MLKQEAFPPWARVVRLLTLAQKGQQVLVVGFAQLSVSWEEPVLLGCHRQGKVWFRYWTGGGDPIFLESGEGQSRQASRSACLKEQDAGKKMRDDLKAS